MKMTQAARRSLLPLGMLLALPLVAAAQGLKVRIVQTNMAGDHLSIIDPVSNRVVAEVSGIDANHGVAAAPDGSRLYVTNESERSVDVVDTKTLKVTKRIPLSDGPHNITISKDGRRVYAAISKGKGGVDVIDTTTLTRVKTIPVPPIHNPFVTPDGKYLVLGTQAPSPPAIVIVDQKTEEQVRKIDLPSENRARPMSFYTNPDGSTKWIIAGLGNLSGFAAFDFATGKELQRIKFPDLGGQMKMQMVPAAKNNPNHGIGVQPDNKAVWASDRWYNMVHGYSLPDLKLIGSVPVAVDPFWVTFTPDSKFVYVSNSVSASVSVVDTQLLREVARIPVGEVPKRNITAMLPDVESPWSRPSAR